MILGLDISTSKIGYAVINNNKDLIDFGLIKYKSNIELELRAQDFINRIDTLRRKYVNIESVFVEQPFIAFSGGKTTAVTMAKLQRFNGMCCYGLYNVFGECPSLISANQTRSLVGIKRKRGEDIKKKVIKWVSETYPKDFTVELTRFGNPKPGTDDMADAIIVALAGLNTLQETQ
jgi:Holliday junction resolvasome RuvABC endonuclease subunit